ncbi:MAG TPA: amidohydrolase [Salegentibacter sp.]|nr:amidohydrolase [Salegentibacter sp.]
MLHKIREFRKELHKHPEISGNEDETRCRVKEFIGINNPGKIIEFEGGGLAVIYEFSEGPVIMIRCELDALPIEETNAFDYRSCNKGVSHKCGHDGHMAIVAVLSLFLKEKPYKQGRVFLLFQPAEETGEGAKALMNDPGFQQLKPDYIFALHNLPGESMHSVILVEDYFSATVQSFKLELIGKHAHASEPEHGINPAEAISELISGFSSLQEKAPEKRNFALLTPVHINMGTKDYGISAGMGEMHYTIRTWDEDEMVRLKKRIRQQIDEVCKVENLKYSIEWFDYFPASKNDEQCNNHIKNAASRNGFATKSRPFPLKFGEDFGWYSQKYKSAMFGIGAGENTPALHHADYDFPDELLETGIKMFSGIIDQILGE